MLDPSLSKLFIYMYYLLHSAYVHIQYTCICIYIHVYICTCTYMCVHECSDMGQALSEAKAVVKRIKAKETQQYFLWIGSIYQAL